MSDGIAAELRATVHRVVAEDPLVSRDRLRDLGWPELLAEEPEVAVAALFESLGETRGTGDALDEVVLAVLYGGETDTGTAVLHPVGETGAVGRPVAGDLVEVDGMLLDRAGAPSRYVLPVADGTAVAWASLDAATTGLTVTPVRGLDATLGWSRVTGRIPRAALEPGASGADGWRRALTAARRAKAHELLGMASRMLVLPVEHARVRTQFGQPIGSFQAVKHLLASVAVVVEAGRSAVGAAWREQDAVSADLACAVSARAHAEAVRGGHQVLGAIGFTWEHEFHRYVRRGRSLDCLYGEWRALQRGIGAAIAASGDVPRAAVLVGTEAS
ncbi:acyl-CoA dehydrogenase family protein [Streptomyces sp. NPDC048254]|uniref:acyl-CoA dehydrogenase family protein n=1 Tax=Streptomyces sp. NPDC048254 TaxID=3365525 RepID=UPI0037191D6F